MAAVLIASTSKASTDGQTVTTDPIDITGAHCLVIFAHWKAVGTPGFVSLVDSEANTLNLEAFGSSLDSTLQTYTCNLPSTSASYTVTLSHPTDPDLRPSLTVLAFSGAERQDNIGDTTGASVHDTTAVVGPMSYAFPDGNVVVTGMTYGLTQSPEPSISGGSLVVQEDIPVSGTAMGASAAYEIQGTYSATTATWSWPNTDRVIATIIGLHPYTPPPPQIVGASVFGVDGTVTSTRAVLFSLDGATNTNSTPGLLKIAGDLEVTGTATFSGTFSGSLDDLSDVVIS